MACGDSPFKVLERIRDDASKFGLLSDVNMNSTMWVTFAPYVEDDFKSLRENPSQEREVHACRTHMKFRFHPYPHQSLILASYIKHASSLALPPILV